MKLTINAEAEAALRRQSSDLQVRAPNADGTYTIDVDSEVHETLNNERMRGESFSDVIIRLAAFYEGKIN